MFIPWVKYEMQSLSMSLYNVPYVFKEKISTLVDGLSYVRTYIGDLLVIYNGSIEEYPERLNEIIDKMKRLD